VSQTIPGLQPANGMTAALARQPAPVVAPPAATPAPPPRDVTPALPEVGPMPGDLNLNAQLAPKVPDGAPRPFAPGEWVQNPNGSWSSEISSTVVNPALNGGKPTIVPTLWLVNGKAVRVDEDTAADYAVKSGLKFRSYNSEDEAEAASIARENDWQGLQPHEASRVPPLWEVPAPRPTAPADILKRVQ
jgi:hypothetical protein